MECVVIQDIVLNEIAKYAHALLPGSSFLAKNSAFTNAERRINRGREMAPSMAGLTDWEATMALSNALGFPMRYRHPSEIMDEIARLTPSFAGVSCAKIDELDSLQWPCNEAAPFGTPTIHVDRFVRESRFMLTEYVPTEESTGAHFPLVLTTDDSDWATNCPEFKVTVVQVRRTNRPSDWQARFFDENISLTRIASDTDLAQDAAD